eukprot:TRINITY_DN71991_c0_g1_i1.p1 TRINITY_DN71991_c0_g1~~TRINITY_DN71991_c0_g1_i1.p1  ORF type:complete len:389 (+),score=66.77 TRINITY_DN71991_c0_g1_i1:146-1312(+)
MKSAWAWGDDDSDDGKVQIRGTTPQQQLTSQPSNELNEEQLVAALVLRDAKTLQASCDFDTLAGSDAARLHKTVNKRLLKGEVNQARSFNRRAGIEPLPQPEASCGDTKIQRDAKTLQDIFVRSAHQIRETVALATTTAEPEISSQERKRQRLGLHLQRAPSGRVGGNLSVKATELEKAEAQLAEDEAEMTNPILKPKAKMELKTRTGKVAAILKPDSGGSSQKREASGLESELQCSPSPVGEPQPDQLNRVEHVPLWPSKGMRVRVVDETGEFKQFHLKKALVIRRHDKKAAVDVELDNDYSLTTMIGKGKLLKEVPQMVLETVVSKTCQQIEVVRGIHQGAIAELVRRDSRQNLATVRIGRGISQKAMAKSRSTLPGHAALQHAIR